MTERKLHNCYVCRSDDIEVFSPPLEADLQLKFVVICGECFHHTREWPSRESAIEEWNKPPDIIVMREARNV